MLLVQPRMVHVRPSGVAGIDDPVVSKQLRKPVSRPPQFGADALPGTGQIPYCFTVSISDHDVGNLIQQVQLCQMLSIAGIGFASVSG